MGGGSIRISITKVHSRTLLALRGGGWGSNLQQQKRYVTFEWYTNTDLPTFYEIKAEDLPPFGKKAEDFKFEKYSDI